MHIHIYVNRHYFVAGIYINIYKFVYDFLFLYISYTYMYINIYVIYAIFTFSVDFEKKFHYTLGDQVLDFSTISSI